MRDARERRLTQELRAYDSKLYAKRESNGSIHVYREGVRFFPFEYHGNNFLASFPSPHFVLALTHNWSLKGRPVDWGIEPLMNRIREIDGWRDDRVADKLIDSYEKVAEQKEKDLRNKNEAFFYDQRSEFKKAFSDINTSNMR